MTHQLNFSALRIGYLMQAGVPDVRKHPLTGPATHVKHVFHELRALGHQVRLLAYLDDRIWKSDDLNDFRPVSVAWLDRGPLRLAERMIRRIQSELQLPYAAMFESIRFAFACCQELADFDILYERMGWVGYGGGLASRWLDLPLVLEVNGDHLNELRLSGIEPLGLQRQLSMALMKQAFRLASYVVVPGESLQEQLVRRWKFTPDKSAVIKNGSEIVDLLARNQLYSFCSDIHRSKPITVIFVGAFEPWHGIPILIKAIAKAIAQGTQAKLVLIGSGSQKEIIVRMIHELEIEPYVTLTGHLSAPQVAVQLANADIGVSPYCDSWEYIGMKLYDYKAAGLAIIASGKDGQPAIIEHGHTGWIVPPCDEDALCKAIIHLAATPDLRKRIGQAARIEAEKYHSWRHTAEQINGVLQQVVTK
jgi:glycosyltransferase involved in cell wall biosynthesis